MKIRTAIVGSLAAIHLLLVSVGAWELTPHAAGRLPSMLLDAYMGLTGAGSSYGFFAPSVASQLRARFLVTDADGSTTEDSFGAENDEEKFRIMTMISTSERVPESRQLLARSWAATIFGRHPGARKVTVLTDMFVVPTMEDARAGSAPRWVGISSSEFERAPRRALSMKENGSTKENGP